MAFPSFDVLSPLQSIDGHRLLEASAGTGKTFAIENIVVRSLLEKDVSLDRVLVLTFTNAATNDLKMRIRGCIVNTIEALSSDNIPETYLKKIFEDGPDAIWMAKRKLRHNLFLFETSQISTLHAFCSRTLTDLSFLDPRNWMVSKTEIHECILSYLRTGLDASFIHPAELAKLWASNSTEDIVAAIEKQITRGAVIAALPSFSEGYAALARLISQFQQKYVFEASKIVEDFMLLSRNYTKISTKQKVLYDWVTEGIQQFAALLENEFSIESFMACIRNGLVWTKALNPKNLSKTFKEVDPSQLNYPHLDQWIRNELEPLLKYHIDEDVLLLRLAGGTQKVFRYWMEREHRCTNDDLLRLMVETSHKPEISTQICAKYDLVIVDEFQDTDPSQWSILKNIFLNPAYPWKGQLILVGDPKQSIYAFRQADIYTYREAAETLGVAAMASLDTNFRSHPRLVAGLNRLFDAQKVPRFIYLPATNENVVCHPVKAGLKVDELSLLPEKEVGIDVVLSEASGQVNEWIAQEILRLNTEHQIGVEHCAVLVAKHTQAIEIGEIFKKYGIAFQLQRNKSLVTSSAYRSLKELLNAIHHCKDVSMVKIALGGKILNWDYTHILGLTDPEQLSNILQKFALWNKKLHTLGIANCIQTVLDDVLKGDSPSYAESILSREDGEEFFKELFQIVELLLEHQPCGSKIQGNILDLFEVLETMHADDESSVAMQGDEKHGVTIITIHSSKGLEYDIVFAQGVISHTQEPPKMMIKHAEEECVIEPVFSPSPSFEKYCEETDAEKMRQFYVAATRAKYKLYLFATETKKQPEKGKASLAELYFSHLSGCGKNYNGLYEGISQLDTDKLRDLVYALDLDTGLVRLRKTDEFDQKPMRGLDEQGEPALLLSEPSYPSFHFSNTYVSSYSALTKSDHELSFSMEHLPPSNWECAEKNIHTLPAGAEIGLVFHSILEDIDFSKPLERAQITAYLSPKMRPWEEVIFETVNGILSAPLPLKDNVFKLSDLGNASLYKETEFLFSSSEHGMLKGFIDLCFEYEHKYYLLDWKTNWLGPSADFYTQPHLQQAMQKNDYFLQANIYTDALKRYFSVVDKRSFEECFGGYYYLFLRGIPGGNGIYSAFHRA